MGILDKIGLKKLVEKKEESSRALDDKKAGEAGEDVSASGQSDNLTQKPKATRSDQLMAEKILVRPVLSEKGTRLAGSGRYVFHVYRSANKSEIAKSIERVYGVTVESVRIINLPGKKRRYGKSVGKTSSWKKAVVAVRAGEKIPGITEAVG